MSEWNKQRLDQMIADGVEESLSLDYKRADSLAKTDGKKAEVTKDVSAFANSTGGVLIYGVAEFGDDAKRHLPERLDPIPRAEISKEWLDQVIQTIQPQIEGLVIHPVTISEQDNTVCYVVEVPQSDTAHMARDHRYYKRHNFNALAMEDYEVRDVMNRTTHPKIRASIFVNKRAGGFKPEGVILVKVENVGRVLARHVMVELELPYDMNGLILPDGDVVCEKNDEGDCYLLRLNQGIGKTPIFPGSYFVFRRKIHTGVQTKKMDGSPIQSARNVKVSIFADEMPALRAKLDVAPVVLGWTPVENGNASR
jgi:hypothetical protein